MNIWTPVLATSSGSSGSSESSSESVKSVDNTIPRYDGTDGALQTSNVVITDNWDVETTIGTKTHKLSEKITVDEVPVSWIEYLTNSEEIDGIETNVTSPSVGVRTSRTYRGKTIYQFEPTNEIQSDRAFYSDELLTELLARRA